MQPGDGYTVLKQKRSFSLIFTPISSFASRIAVCTVDSPLSMIPATISINQGVTGSDKAPGLNCSIKAISSVFSSQASTATA